MLPEGHEIADAFDLDGSDIRWAPAYEMPLYAACAIGQTGNGPLLYRCRRPRLG
jgi:hypothetical protein